MSVGASVWHSQAVDECGVLPAERDVEDGRGNCAHFSEVQLDEGSKPAGIPKNNGKNGIKGGVFYSFRKGMNKRHAIFMPKNRKTAGA